MEKKAQQTFFINPSNASVIDKEKEFRYVFFTTAIKENILDENLLPRLQRNAFTGRPRYFIFAEIAGIRTGKQPVLLWRHRLFYDKGVAGYLF